LQINEITTKLVPFFLTGIGLFVYLVWFVLKSSDACPICGNTHLLRANTKAKMIQADKERG
jgi:hypothetical protein